MTSLGAPFSFPKILCVRFWTRGTSTFRLGLLLSALIHFCIIFVIYGKIADAIMNVYQPDLTKADNYLDVELIDESALPKAFSPVIDLVPTPIPTPK